MDTKLTVKLDGNVISRAKIYARKRNTSLSKMIENYLDVVSKPESGETEITPLVQSLDDKIVDLALNSDFKDFKDGIQYFTAIENVQKLIITRNKSDFKASKIPVMTAGEFLKSIIA